MAKKVYGYVRVSTKEQNEARQVNAIKEYCNSDNLEIDSKDILVDKQSGNDFNRPAYQTLKNQILRKGDILIIKELDRLGRNMEMIKKEWQELIEKGIDIIVIDTEILNTSKKSDLEKNLISNIVLELLSYVAEKETKTRAKRQKEGIKAAKQAGKHLGRPRKDYASLSNIQKELIKKNYPKWKAKEMTAVKFMDILELKRNTFYNIMAEYKELSKGE